MSTFTSSYLKLRTQGLYLFEKLAQYEKSRLKSKSKTSCLIRMKDVIERVEYSRLGEGQGGGFILNVLLKAVDAPEIAIKVIRLKSFKKTSQQLVDPSEQEISVHQRLVYSILLHRHAPGLVITGEVERCSAKKMQTFIMKNMNLGKNELSSFKHFVSNMLGEDSSFISLPMEKAKGDVLTHLLHNQPKTDWYRRFFFVLFFTLSAIQHQYPAFRHNDMHLSNILLVHAPTILPEVYQLGATRFVLPSSIYTPCLSDFGWTSINEDSLVNFPPWVPGSFRMGRMPFTKRDLYHDVHTLCSHMIHLDQQKLVPLPGVVRKFLNRVIPPSLQTEQPVFVTYDLPLSKDYEKRDRLEFLPLLLQKDSFFKPFREYPSDIQTGNHWHHSR